MMLRRKRRQRGVADIAAVLAAIAYAVLVGVVVGIVVRLIMGMLFPVEEPETIESSPSYGFNQFRNRFKGDSPVPVVYANDTASAVPGHRVAPIYVQAFTTPRGIDADDIVKTTRGRSQSISILMAVCEGPVVDLRDVRINNEPVFEEITDRTVAERPNGSRLRFTVEAERVDLSSVRVTVNGTAKGWTSSTRDELVGIGVANSTTTFYRIALSANDGGAQRIDESGEVRFYLGATPSASTLLALDADAKMRPHVWQDEDGLTLNISTHTPIPAGKKLWARIPVARMTGITLSALDSLKGFALDFATAPASGAVIKVSYLRSMFSGVRVEKRLGVNHQLPLDGFDDTRNETTIGPELERNVGQTFSTREDVDDVVVTIASAPNGFITFSAKGNPDPVVAQFRIEWKLATEADSAYRVVKDPSGAIDSKTADEFEVRGQSTGQLFWSFSIRRLLIAYQAKNPKSASALAHLSAFRRNRFSVRVTRTLVVAANTSPSAADRIHLWSYQSVIYARASMPGTALLAFHGIASEKLQGSLPQITCRVIGKRDVEVYAGGAWTPSETAQANPVWATIDFLTSRDFGAGDFYTKAANIDTASAVTAAAWCDADETNAGQSEKRAVIDYVADTQLGPMDHARQMLLPHRVVPVLQGNKWRFIPDRDVDLTTVETIYEDGASGRMLRDSLAFAHPPITDDFSELQVSYLDRDDDHEKNEIWIGPKVPATVRRVQKAQAYGTTRGSEVGRYATFLHAKSTNTGFSCAWQMTCRGFSLEAGDVVRIISTRQGIDAYVRIMAWELVDTERYTIAIEATQYIPAVYGQNVAAQTVRGPRPGVARSLSLSAPSSAARTGTGRSTSSGRPAVRVRRVA